MLIICVYSANKIRQKNRGRNFLGVQVEQEIAILNGAFHLRTIGLHLRIIFMTFFIT